MEDPALRNEILEIVGPDAVTFAGSHHPDDLHDESLHAAHVEPFAVVRPSNTRQVSELAKFASRHGVPVTPRGSGTGLSGAATAGAVSSRAAGRSNMRSPASRIGR